MYLKIISILFLILPGCTFVPIEPKGLRTEKVSKTYKASWAKASPTVWNFSNPSDPLKASSGKGLLSFRDANGTGWGSAKTKFGKASRFGLPPLPGGDSRIMRFPATLPGEGYLLTHGGSPNGAFGRKGMVSNYTLVMDVLWPKSSFGKYRSLYQTDSENKDDAEMYLHDSKRSGIGVKGKYNGKMEENKWHRIAISVQAASGRGGVGQMHKFIDGRFVGGHGTNSKAPISRWALGKELVLFTDSRQKTAEGYVSSIYFVDRNLSMDEVAKLGGPNAAGANVPGPIQKYRTRKLPRPVKIIAHRGDSCCAPENTIAAIRQAFDKGAEMIEVDIRRSGDGIALLMHDEQVDRTTNGTGPVNKKTLKKLKSLDAGSWFSPEFVGTRIPTLTEALRETKGRGKLVLDVKSIEMGTKIKKAMKEAGVGPEALYVWQNKAAAALDDFRKNIPDVGILWGGVPKELTDEVFRDLRDKGVVGFDLDIYTEKVTSDFIRAAHKNNMFVSVYTILDPDKMRKVVNMGVDAMETDFVAVLDEMRPD